MTEIAKRPLLYLRVAFDKENAFLGWNRGDMGSWVQGLFRDEQAALMDDLTVARTQNPAPTKLIADIQQRARWCVSTLADIDSDMLMPSGERRFRLFRGGHADWVQSVLRDEQAELYDDLAQFRADGRAENEPEVAEVRRQLEWSVQILRDVDAVRINLVGPDEDPRQ